MSRHVTTVLAIALAAFLKFGNAEPFNYPAQCKPDDPYYNMRMDPNAPKIKPTDGFEVFMQIPIYGQVHQSIDPNVPKLQYPVNETFFIRAFGDQNSRGAMYIAAKHSMISLLYDKQRNESQLIDYQYGSCDVEPMTYEPGFTYGYFHGVKSPIHVPFPDMLVDLTKFNVRKLDNAVRYRGFRNVQRYEGCINLRSMLVHVLKNLNSPIPIPDILINNGIPDPVALKVTWYWADPAWEMEDGYPAAGAMVPVGIELTGAVTAATRLAPEYYIDLLINATLAMANYHSHYPPHDPLEDLLQSPPGIHCKRLPTPATIKEPTYPTFPQKFHVKAESVVIAEKHQFVYNSEDYYDFEKQLYRFDVSLHRPDKAGPVKVELFHDYPNNVAYEINRAERTCKRRDLSEQPTSGKFEEDVITHLLMRPTDIISINDINPSYIGRKHCRGMECHYWVGRRDLNTLVDGKPTYGIYGVWATTKKWSSNFSSNAFEDHFITEIDVQIYDKKSKKLVGREHLQLFDYMLITGDEDLYFKAPTDAFCDDGDNPKRPGLPKRYQYHGEYSEQKTNSTAPIFLNYDVDWNVVRFDWTPVEFESDKKLNFPQAYVYDRSSATNYRINKVTGECKIKHMEPEYAGDDIDPLALIWPPRLHEHIVGRNMKYIGVHPCRRMMCDSFELEEPRGDVNHIYEYQFTTDKFQETSLDSPEKISENVLTRVGRIRIEDEHLDRNHLKAVEIFSFSDQRASYWEYEVVAPCFEGVGHKWIRMYFTVVPSDDLKQVHKNDYFRVHLMEAIRRNATNITPLRIADLVVEMAGDDRIAVEFKLRDRHPEENFKGPSLGDAINDLTAGVATGGFVVNVKVPVAGDPPTTNTYVLTADNTLETCEKPCSAEQYMMPTIELDVGALIGTIIGSVIAGILVITLILTIIVSRKHQVPMQSLYVGVVPGTGVSHDLPSVSMSSGISVTKNGEYDTAVE